MVKYYSQPVKLEDLDFKHFSIIILLFYEREAILIHYNKNVVLCHLLIL